MTPKPDIAVREAAKNVVQTWLALSTLGVTEHSDAVDYLETTLAGSAQTAPEEERWTTHYDTIPHANCQDPEHCDCTCSECKRVKREPAEPQGAVLSAEEFERRLMWSAHSQALKDTGIDNLRAHDAALRAALSQERTAREMLEKQAHDRAVSAVLNNKRFTQAVIERDALMKAVEIALDETPWKPLGEDVKARLRKALAAGSPAAAQQQDEKP